MSKYKLLPLPGEQVARKMILPFKSFPPGKLLRNGTLIMGSPSIPGCPVPHVCKIISHDVRSDILTVHVVGPREGRGETPPLDIGAYHMVGFEGILEGEDVDELGFGYRIRFLPGFCMMGIEHEGLINFIEKLPDGRTHVKIGGITVPGVNA